MSRNLMSLLVSLVIPCVICLSCGDTEDATEAKPLTKDTSSDTVFSTVLVNNLRMRTEPNIESETITLLPQGIIVRTWGERSHEKFQTVLRDQRVSDYWYRARYGPSMGWVFGGGLQGVTDDPFKNELLLPGIQAGPVLASDTEQDVINRLGKKHSERRTISIGEGKTIQGTAIFPGTKKEMLLLWIEEDFRRLHEVRIEHPESPWHTESGIKIGLDLKSIERINQEAFMLTGFEWDYAGTTTSWNRGTQPEELVLTFAEPERFHKELIGDKSFSSDNPRMRRANPKVKRIRILF